MTIEHLELLATIIIAFATSSGFWAFMAKTRKANDSRDKLIIGLAHDRIIDLASKYLRRKYITQDEYENLHDFLYVPYIEMGGNGTAKKMMAEVEKIPIRASSIFDREKNNVEQ